MSVLFCLHLCNACCVPDTDLTALHVFSQMCQWELFLLNSCFACEVLNLQGAKPGPKSRES